MLAYYRRDAMPSRNSQCLQKPSRSYTRIACSFCRRTFNAMVRMRRPAKSFATALVVCAAKPSPRRSRRVYYRRDAMPSRNSQCLRKPSRSYTRIACSFCCRTFNAMARMPRPAKSFATALVVCVAKPSPRRSRRVYYRRDAMPSRNSQCLRKPSRSYTRIACSFCCRTFNAMVRMPRPAKSFATALVVCAAKPSPRRSRRV